MASYMQGFGRTNELNLLALHASYMPPPSITFTVHLSKNKCLQLCKGDHCRKPMTLDITSMRLSVETLNRKP